MPLPCDSLAALAAEVDNPRQAGCSVEPDTAVSGALVARGHAHFLQLLTATGLLPAVDKTANAFTIYAPTDAALEAAAARGAFNYGRLYATNRSALAQAVGYHVAPGAALAAPPAGPEGALYSTLLTGDPGCEKGAPEWGADGLVRGGRGVGREGAVTKGAERARGGPPSGGRACYASARRALRPPQPRTPPPPALSLPFVHRADRRRAGPLLRLLCAAARGQRGQRRAVRRRQL